MGHPNLLWLDLSHPPRVFPSMIPVIHHPQKGTVTIPAVGLRERSMGVLATSDRALQTAMLLPDWSEHVTLFTNGVLTLGPEQLAELSARGVSVEAVPVVALLGDAPALSGLRLDDGRITPVDAVFTSPRTRMASPLAEQLGCDFEEGPSGPFIRTGADKQTTVRGVYAAGDAARPGHNASWAAADGVTAGIFPPPTPALAPPRCRCLPP